MTAEERVANHIGKLFMQLAVLETELEKAHQQIADFGDKKETPCLKPRWPTAS